MPEKSKGLDLEEILDDVEVPTAAKARRCTECDGIITLLSAQDKETRCLPREGDGRECELSTNSRNTPMDERIKDDIQLYRQEDVREALESAVEKARKQEHRRILDSDRVIEWTKECEDCQNLRDAQVCKYHLGMLQLIEELEEEVEGLE